MRYVGCSDPKNIPVRGKRLAPMLPSLERDPLEIRVMAASLSELYTDYLACLNTQDWDQLGRFVDADVVHNGRPFGLDGYRRMLQGNFRDIPDLHFVAELRVAEASMLAVRLAFDCTPVGDFLGLPIRGKRVAFAEHAIYAFENEKIREVWSVIDKDAIEAQL
jgi:predicted ester cyclase